jgi:hypothetical protein
MSGSSSACLVALSLCCAVSCAAGEDVLLGHEAAYVVDAPGLTAADGGGVWPDVPEPRFLREVPVRAPCSQAAAASPLRLRVELDVGLCGDALCDSSGTWLEQLLPLADESVWTTLRELGGRAGVTQLAHFDRAGVALGAVEASGVDARLVGDPHGTLWMLATAASGRTLQRFDAAARPVAEPMSVATRAQRLAVLPSEGVLVIESGEPGAMTLFDFDGTPRWTQPTGIVGDDVDVAVGTNQFALFGTVPREPAYVGIDVVAFSLTGELLWRKHSTVNLEAGGFLHGFAAGMDAGDNVVIATEPPMASADEIDRADYLDLERFTSAGDSDWAFRLQTVQPAFGATVAPSGELYVSAAPSPADGDSALIDRISADGMSCERFVQRDVYALTHVAISPNGRLWLGQQQRATQHSEGERRFARVGAGRP